GAPPVNLYQFFARELTMHGSRLYSRHDWEEAIRLGAAGAVSLAPLVSRRIPLESLQQGMEETLRAGPVMKVLIDLNARRPSRGMGVARPAIVPKTAKVPVI